MAAKTHNVSPEGRKRIAAAQRKRWKRFRKMIKVAGK